MLERLRLHITTAVLAAFAAALAATTLGLVSAYGQAGEYATVSALLGAAPLVLALLTAASFTLGLAGGAAAFALTRGTPGETVDGWVKSLVEPDPAKTGKYLGTLLFVAMFLALVAVEYMIIDRAFKHATLKALLGAALAFATYLAARGAAKVTADLISALARKLFLRAEIFRFLGSLSFLIPATLAVGVGLGVGVFVGYRKTIADIGFSLVLGGLAGAVLVFASWTAAARWQHHLPALLVRLRWQSAWFLVFLGIALGLGEFPGVRSAALRGGTPQALASGLLQKATDFDGDGYSGFLGGGDCRPFDEKFNPDASDIPNNGLDENCMGGDLVFDGAGSADTKYYDLPEDFPEGVNLVLITVDAVRWDHTSLYGYERETTPSIDRLARSAVVFERGYSQGPGTIPSAPSFTSSLYPYQLVYSSEKARPKRIAEENVMMGEIFSAAGYFTGTVNTIRYITNDWGITQGMDVVDTSMVSKPYSDCENAPDVTRASIEFARKNGDRKFLLWAHYYEPHSSYAIHEGTPRFSDSTDDIDLYDHEILYADKHVGELIEYLQTYEHADRTVIILGGDHGEGFPSDRGKRTHGYGLFEEQTHVPFVVWAPGAKPRRVETPVGLVDIIPTFCNAAGIDQQGLEGSSLIPFLFDEDYEELDRRVFMENNKGKVIKQITKALVGVRWKYIYDYTNGLEYLFDLENDPGEKENVVDEHPDVAADHKEQLLSIMDRVSLPVQASVVEKYRVDEVPDDATRLNLVFGDAVEIVAYRQVEVKRREARIELFLRSVGQADLNYNLQVGVAAKPPVRKPTKIDPVFGYYPLTQWEEGEMFRQEITLKIPKKKRKGKKLNLYARFIWKKEVLEPPSNDWKNYARIGHVKTR